MRLPASEKLEIIGLVEQSHLPARRTLQMLGSSRRRSTAGMTGFDLVALKLSKPPLLSNRHQFARAYH
jgi:hypothetical protein